MRRTKSGVGADAGLVAFLVPTGMAHILTTETEVSEALAENGARQLSLHQNRMRATSICLQSDIQSECPKQCTQRFLACQKRRKSIGSINSYPWEDCFSQFRHRLQLSCDIMHPSPPQTLLYTRRITRYGRRLVVFSLHPMFCWIVLQRRRSA